MKTLYEDSKGCYRKVGFNSAKAARKFFRDLKQKHLEYEMQYVYDCKTCGKFHLTKNKEAENKIL